jgi:hypothetical protein
MSTGHLSRSAATATPLTATSTAGSRQRWRALASNPLLYRLDAWCGRWLAALPCELVWATTWMADANEVIGPLFGLSELPIVHWREDADDDQPGLVHWKGGLGRRTPLRLDRRRDHRRRPALG